MDGSSVAESPPMLLRGLAGHAKTGADLGPGVANGAQSVDGLLNCVVDVIGQADHMD